MTTDSNLIFIAVMFPGLENVLKRFNYSIFDKKLMAYYKRLINSAIEHKQAVKEKAVSSNAIIV